jgi:hypothetical protein
MPLALAAFLCVGSGFALVSIAWPRHAPLAAGWLRISLSVGFGLGLFSVNYIFALALNLITHLIAVDLVVFTLLLASYLLIRQRTAVVAVPQLAKSDPGRSDRVVTIAFGIALSAALYAAILRAMTHPDGEGWDAFSIWNLHARFLFRDAAHWRDGFSSVIPWSHPDYPLLLSAAIAHFWSYLGYESKAVPTIIGLVFSFSTVGLLCSSLLMLRGRTPAMLGGLALLATPFFIQQGTSQYADVPLSFFYLATMVLFSLDEQPSRDSSVSRRRGLPVLAGLAAGLAAWTKNEGLLFLCALVIARLFVLIRPRTRTASNTRSSADGTPVERWKDLAILLLSLTLLLLLIGWFKHWVAPPGDLFSDSVTAFRKLRDASRYMAALKWFGKEFVRFGHWLLIPGTLLLAAFYLATRSQTPSHSTAEIRLPAITLALTLVGYFAVYLITPYDIYWHLRFSLNRLYLQLWPSAIFLLFLLVPPDDGAAAISSASRTPAVSK